MSTLTRTEERAIAALIADAPPLTDQQKRTLRRVLSDAPRHWEVTEGHRSRYSQPQGESSRRRAEASSRRIHDTRVGRDSR